MSLRDSLRRHILSVLPVETELGAFYRTSMFKIKSFHRSQAQKAITNKGLDMLISQAGIHHYHGAGAGSRPLFVIGDGEFGGRGQILYKYIVLLKKKVRARTALVGCYCATV